MTAPRDPERLIKAFLGEGEEQLHDQVYDAVRASIEHKRQRVVIGPWSTPTMNRFLTFGLAAAAVVVAVLIGAQLLTSPGGGIGNPPSPSEEPTAEPTPEATEAPSATVVTNTDVPVQVTVSTASSDWVPLPGNDAITKDDDGLDPPDSVGAAFLAWSWPAGAAFDVYGDPCEWSTTIPETPATTPDEIAAALAAQELSEPTAPVDVTVGGYQGKALTVSVPMTFHLPGSTREERFADCDQSIFGYYGIEGETGPSRNAQGAGQIDELWILDVDGNVVILDATYSPATPADLIAEMRAMAESATFEAP